MAADLAVFYSNIERMYGRVMTHESDTTCPYCNKIAAMVYIDDSARIVNSRTMRVEGAFQCYACKRFVIGGKNFAGFTTDHDGKPFPLDLYPDSNQRSVDIALIDNVEYWEPISPVGKIYDFALEEIAGPADEAHRCFSIGAYRASILLARAVIEATAKKNGITKGQLYPKIEEMGARGVIRKQTVQAAHGVRDVGNDMAHGDFATADVSASDAADVLVLMDVVLNDAFAGDSALNKLTSRRSSRDESAPSN